MEVKKWLQEGYCPVDHYQCLMPVEYLGQGDGDIIKEYHKNRMVCRHALAGNCEQKEECTFLKEAPEVLDKNTNWYEE